MTLYNKVCQYNQGRGISRMHVPNGHFPRLALDPNLNLRVSATFAIHRTERTNLVWGDEVRLVLPPGPRLSSIYQTRGTRGGMAALARLHLYYTRIAGVFLRISSYFHV